MYVPQYLIHSSLDGHLGCFHVLDILVVQQRALGLLVSLSYSFSDYIPSNL